MTQQTQKPQSKEEMELRMEEEYWHQKSLEEADYFAQRSQLQERED